MGPGFLSAISGGGVTGRSYGARMVSDLDRFRGCLLAGAVGDALGSPIEFSSLSAIRQGYGDRVSLTDLPRAAFTDDTQMTLFTAEGLIRSSVRARTQGSDADLIGVTHRAYLRWLHTQGVAWAEAAHGLDGAPLDGWLVTNRVLHRREAPGNTCLSALHSGRIGTTSEALNNSKGCGGVMRAAPAGLFAPDAATAFAWGNDVAAITHGHPSGYFSAGALAVMVAELLQGADMEAAVEAAAATLTAPEAAETLGALLAGAELGRGGLPAAEDLEDLGGGWVGEEALAIAVACAMAPSDLASALSAAVLHSGDSDSTGAICGNLLGAQWGVDAIPSGWVEALDGGDVVDAVARDLWAERYEPPPLDGDAWLERYPAN